MSKPISLPNNKRKAPFRARRRRGTFSTCLNARQVTEIYSAGHFAAQTNTPLNRFITIHLEKGGVVGEYEIVISHFLKQAGDWLRRKGRSLNYIWVREAGFDKGEHVHILMHLPPDLPRAFANRQRQWLTQAGVEPRKNVIKTMPIGLSYKHCFYGVQYGQSYDAHLQQTLAYVLKESEPGALFSLGIVRLLQQSSLKGQRYSVSTALGPAARRKLK